MKTEIIKTGNSVTLDRNRSIFISFIILIAFMALSILFGVVINWKAGLIFLSFFGLALIMTLAASFLGNFTMAVINMDEKEVTLTSKLLGKNLKQTKIKPYDKLYFDSYNRNGYKKYAIFIDEKKEELIWDDLYSKQAEEISRIMDR